MVPACNPCARKCTECSLSHTTIDNAAGYPPLAAVHVIMMHHNSCSSVHADICTYACVTLLAAAVTKRLNVARSNVGEHGRTYTKDMLLSGVARTGRSHHQWALVEVGHALPRRYHRHPHFGTPNKRASLAQQDYIELMRDQA